MRVLAGTSRMPSFMPIPSTVGAMDVGAGIFDVRPGSGWLFENPGRPGFHLGKLVQSRGQRHLGRP